MIVRGATGTAFLAGDASFSLDQVERRAVAGICEDRAAARRTLDVIAEHLAETGAHYLATHAASSASRRARPGSSADRPPGAAEAEDGA